MQPATPQKHSLLHPSHKEWKSETNLAFDQDNPPPKTRGEKNLQRVRVGGFGWVANALVSIKLADWATYRFRPFFEKQSVKLAESSIVKSIFKDEAKSFAQSFVSVVTLLPGGYSVIAPIKFFEDRKIALVRTLDKWFGKSNANENDTKLQEARYEYLDQQPKISWSNLISGRTVPVAMVLGTHFAFAKEKANIVNAIAGEGTFSGLDKNYDKMAKSVYARLEGRESTRALLRTQEARLEKNINKIRHNAKPENQHFYNTNNTGRDRVQNYIGNTFVDIGYSAFVAATTFIASHLFAFRSEEKRELRTTAHPQQKQSQIAFSSAESANPLAAPSRTENLPQTTIHGSKDNQPQTLEEHRQRELA